MRYLSVCSGIEAATVAWQPLGWFCAGVAEIEKFPCEVLNYRHPTIHNYGDITKYKEWPLQPIDVLIGGTPCQSFSVAGLRKGLDDPRGNLAFAFLGIAARFAPRWVVFENVPGLLSVDEGRAFGSFLGALAELGYGFAYTILDAQWFGVAQRRERVFVVGHIGGNWQRAAAVLFDATSLSGNPAPRRTQGEGITHDVAPCIGASGRGFNRTGETRGQDPVIAETVRSHPRPGSYNAGLCVSEVAAVLRSGSTNGASHNKASGLDDNLVAHSLRADGFDASEDGTGRGTPLVPEVCGTITKNYSTHHGRQAGNNGGVAEGQMIPEVAWALQERDSKGSDSSTKDGHLIPVSSGMSVRRLTPRECERLQGFPDDYTAIPRGKKTAEQCADGPRYKALGNSMAVPVIQWIGKRIMKVDAI